MSHQHVENLTLLDRKLSTPMPIVVSGVRSSDHLNAESVSRGCSRRIQLARVIRVLEHRVTGAIILGEDAAQT